MRTLTAVFLVLVLALPAMAQDDFQVVEISHDALESSTGPITHHRVDARSGNLDEISTAINGYFLWIRYGDGETVSIDVSDPTITQAVVFTDGTVELTREASEPPQPEPETIDLVEEFPGVITRLPEFPVF